jgi:MFS family permease
MRRPCADATFRGESEQLLRPCLASDFEMTAASAESPWPSRAAGTAMLAFLMFAAVLSLADRQILSLLVGPLRASLGLSDIEIALLQGLAFTVFYSAAAIPMGWLVDRSHRRNLLVLAISVWSLATLACAFADSFAWLFVCRLFVGLAEAVLSPAAISLIADYFVPARRGRAVSLFLAGGLAGGGLSMVGGGFLILAVQTLPPLELGSRQIEPWGFVFAALGIFGLLFAQLGLLLPEPTRREVSAARQAAGLLPWLKQRKRWWIPHFGGMAMQTMIFYAILSWVPAFLMRVHGLTATEAALGYGLSLAVAAPIGAVVAGRTVEVLRVRRRQAPALDVAILGVLVAAASNIAAMFAPSLVATLALLAFGAFWLAVPVAVSAAAVQDSTPNELRGQVSAIYFFTTTLVGLSIGPLAVAVLTDRVFGLPEMTGISIAVVTAVAAPFATLLLLKARVSFAPVLP